MSDRGLAWDTEPTDQQQLVKDIYQALLRHIVTYPSLNGWDVLAVLAHIAGSVVADAPLDMQAKVKEYFTTRMDVSIDRHLDRKKPQ